MSSAGLSIDELRTLIKRGLDASNDLQARIDRLQQDVAEGKTPDTDATSLMSTEHKRIGKDLVLRIEQIEDQGRLDATDRTMLQALTARLSVHDLQSARLAQYRDLQLKDGEDKYREWLVSDELPSGSRNVVGEGRSANALPVQEPVVTLDTHHPQDEQPSVPTMQNVVFPSRNESSIAGMDDHDEELLAVNSGQDDPTDVLETYNAPDKSTWPLLYRIVDLDPKTPSDHFNQQLDR
jgi:hypothetical protein